VRISDRLEIKDKRTTRDGYLVTEAKFARSGIYNYSGREVGKPQMDTVRVFRPEEEVFSADAMASFAHRPITNDHPEGFVDAQNWKDHAVGFTDGKVARDGDFVVIPMMVTDQAAVSDVNAGKAELSAGYDCDIEFLDGETPTGEKYDAIMTNIRGNHIALVDRGRAGPDCRIGDTKEPKTMKIMFDGIEIDATDQSAQAITKLNGLLETSRTDLATADTAHKSAIEAKDKELAAKDAEIADLKGKVLDAAALDKLVADRAKLVALASKIADGFDCSGKTDAEIKRGVVLAKCGDAAVKDKSDAYIDARFDTLVEGIGSADAIAEVIQSGHVGTTVISGKTVDQLREDERKALADSLDLNAHRSAKK
jgi:hypothetical protein